MPHVDYLIIRGCVTSDEVRPVLQKHRITELGELLQKEDVEEVLLEALGDFPDSVTCVVFQDTSWRFKHYVFLAYEGRLDEEEISWSLKEDARDEFKLSEMDESRVPLSVEADNLLDIFEEATHEEGQGAFAKGHLLKLPGRFSALPKARPVLAQVAAVLEPKQFQVLVDIAGRYYVATLERKKGVTLAPLYPWAEHDDVRQLMRQAVGAPEPGGFEPCPKKEPAKATSQRDPARPFTTGSLKARLDSLHDFHSLSTLMETGHWTAVEAPGAFVQLEAALRAPENAEPGFAEVRRELYKMLFKYWPERTRPLLFAGLEGEQDEAVRGQLYACLSKVEDPAAYQALARGMKVEPPGVVERLAQVVWRQKPVLELLVREYLVPAWPGDRALADRIVKVLRDEYVEVPAAWVAGAPEELLKALGPVLGASEK